MQIVRFRPEHLPRVLEIERASFGAAAWPGSLFRELYARCRELFFVARTQGRVVGYVMSAIERGDAEVTSIAVDPVFRRRGVGRALMRHTLRHLKAAGARAVWLMVRSSDAGAVGFYRRLGFRAVGRAPGYYEDGTEALRMQRRL